MRYQFDPFWHRLGKLGLWRLYGNTLPYPVNRRYMRYGQYCKGQASAHKGWPLRDGDPIVVRSALAPADARQCSASISAALASGRLQHSAAVSYMVPVPQPLDMFGSSLLDIFNGPLGEQLRELYEGEFRVEWLDCYRTYPGERDASWLWHIDNVPPFLLKVLLYLTDSDSRTGATEFLSGSDTRRFKAAGYFGITKEERRMDVAMLARSRGMPYRPISFALSAGDAVVFSTNTLHRGGLVSEGFRDVMSFMIFPSPIPWQAHQNAIGTHAVQVPGGFPVDPFAKA